IVPAICLERPFTDEGLITVKTCETADVDDPEVERSLAGLDPMGKRPAGAAGAGDAEGVEAGTDIEIVELGGATEDEIAVRREAFRPMDHPLDASALERRHPGQCLQHVLFEMLPIVLEQLKGEIGRRQVDHPGPRIGLVATHDEATDLLLEIGAAV